MMDAEADGRPTTAEARGYLPDRVSGRYLLPTLAMMGAALLGVLVCVVSLVLLAGDEQADPFGLRMAFWGGAALVALAVYLGTRAYALARAPGRYVIVLEHRVVNRVPVGTAFRLVPKGPQPTHWLHLIDAVTEHELGWVQVSNEDAHHLEQLQVVALWGRLRERSTLVLNAPGIEVRLRGIRPTAPLEGGVEGLA